MKQIDDVLKGGKNRPEDIVKNRRLCKKPRKIHINTHKELPE